MSSKLREVGILATAVVAAALWAYWPHPGGTEPSSAAAGGQPIPRMRLAKEYGAIEQNVRAGRDRFSLPLLGENRVIVLSTTLSAPDKQRDGPPHYDEIKVHQEGPWGAAKVTYELESVDGVDNILRVQISPEPRQVNGEEDFMVYYPNYEFLHDFKRQKT